ncbi:MAG: dihydrolipoamide acetyltransferase family protein [Phycisphaerales bacterium]
MTETHDSDAPQRERPVMSIDITMPRLSDTMEAGTIIKWNVSPGDEVSSGDVVADVETDKATMELAAFDDGVVASILVPEGQQVDVGSVIAVLAEDGEDVDKVASGAASGEGSSAAASGGGTAVADPPATATSAAPAPASAPVPAPAGGSSNGTAAVTGGGAGRMKVSPVARRLAEEHGVNLSAIAGSGPQGRIIKRDVLAAIEAGGTGSTGAAPAAAAAPAPVAAAPAAGSVTAIVPSAGPTITVESTSDAADGTPSLGAGRVPLSGMRQTIARRLVESKQQIPHYQVSMSFDMEPLVALRKDLNGKLANVGIKLSVNDFLVKGCALAMHEHPEFNASFDGDSVVYHAAVNVGVAISLPPERGGGLVVATIREADHKSLRTLSAETKGLAEKARTRGLSVDEMSDSTFTISNLGMFGVDHFTAIINPPNAAILAVGQAVQKPFFETDEDGEPMLVVGHEMSMTISSDHRIIDGAMAAQYLGTVKELLENPAALLV